MAFPPVPLRSVLRVSGCCLECWPCEPFWPEGFLIHSCILCVGGGAELAGVSSGADISKLVIQIRMIRITKSPCPQPRINLIYPGISKLCWIGSEWSWYRQIGMSKSVPPPGSQTGNRKWSQHFTEKGEASSTIVSELKYKLSQCWCVLRLDERQSLYWVNQLCKSAQSWKKSSAISN